MLLSLALAATLAQPLQHDSETWLFLSVSGREGKARWYGEVQPRFSFTKMAVERLVVRPAVGFQLTETVSLWAGFVWVHGLLSGGVNERRPYQQLLVEHRLGRVSITNRTRLEERFFEVVEAPSYRLRHQLRLGYRFIPELGLFVAEELFVNLNSVSAGPHAGLDQQRLMVGVSVRLGALTIEVGYLNLFTEKIDAPDRMSHDLITTISYAVP